MTADQVNPGGVVATGSGAVAAGDVSILGTYAAGRDLNSFLPLALRIVGARLAAKRHWTLERMAVRLSDERRPGR